MEVLTKDECKKILGKLGFKLGVSPSLIATRLLDEKDKKDMREGRLDIDALEIHICEWINNGKPDYVQEFITNIQDEKNKSGSQFENPQQCVKFTLRAPFIEY